jgi:hypothetical protein
MLEWDTEKAARSTQEKIDLIQQILGDVRGMVTERSRWLSRECGALSIRAMECVNSLG